MKNRFFSCALILLLFILQSIPLSVYSAPAPKEKTILLNNSCTLPIYYTGICIKNGKNWEPTETNAKLISTSSNFEFTAEGVFNPNTKTIVKAACKIKKRQNYYYQPLPLSMSEKESIKQHPIDAVHKKTDEIFIIGDCYVDADQITLTNCESISYYYSGIELFTTRNLKKMIVDGSSVKGEFDFMVIDTYLQEKGGNLYQRIHKVQYMIKSEHDHKLYPIYDVKDASNYVDAFYLNLGKVFNLQRNSDGDYVDDIGTSSEFDHTIMYADHSGFFFREHFLRRSEKATYEGFKSDFIPELNTPHSVCEEDGSEDCVMCISYSDGSTYKGTISATKWIFSRHVVPDIDSSYFLNGEYTSAEGNVATYVNGLTASEELRLKQKYEESKRKDFFKLDSYGDIDKFRFTYPDLCVLKYNKNEGTSDGTILKFAYSNKDTLEIHVPQKIKITASTYKKIVNFLFHPSMTSSWCHVEGWMIRMSLISDYLITLNRMFNDDITIRNKWGQALGIYMKGAKQGERATFGHREQSLVFELVGATKYFNDTTDIACICDDMIVYKSGSYFEGINRIDLPQQLDSSFLSDKRFVNMGISIRGSLNDIKGATPLSGRLYSSKGQLLAIYEGGHKLDDVDFQSTLKREEGERKRQQERREEKRKQITAIVNKYGEDVASAFSKGKIVVGMPLDLIQDGLECGIFRFNKLSLSIDSDYSKCYDMYAYINWDLKNVGYLWVKDGKVSTIVYYKNY